MKLSMLLCFTLLGCSSSQQSGFPAIEAGCDDAKTDAKEAAHVCGAFECGPGCDACPGNMQCGDNGYANQCGNACVPYPGNGICWENNPDPTIMYVQYPASCNYIDVTWCILVQLPRNGGIPPISVWCCNTPDGGSSVVSYPTGSANFTPETP